VYVGREILHFYHHHDPTPNHEVYRLTCLPCYLCRQGRLKNNKKLQKRKKGKEKGKKDKKNKEKVCRYVFLEENNGEVTCNNVQNLIKVQKQTQKREQGSKDP
jgi:hypothetical protein